jgi:nucleoside-diphosphate-sugar epimerase
MVKTILLTGCTGFRGSIIGKKLREQFNVVTLGRSKTCDYIVDLSIWDGSLILEHSIDAIVHVAGLAHNKAHSSGEMRRVNVSAVDFLLKLASRESIANFVFISSVAVYGQNYALNINEDSVLRPKSV